jgi:uncharacterized membrane protein SpoIIM required for sporulation
LGITIILVFLGFMLSAVADYLWQKNGFEKVSLVLHVLASVIYTVTGEH